MGDFYEEWKARNGYGSNPKTTDGPKQETPSKSDLNPSSNDFYENWKRRNGYGSNTAPSVDEDIQKGFDDLNSFFSDWENWYTTSSNALDDMDWETGRGGRASLIGMDNYAGRYASSRQFLEDYKDQLNPEYYNQMVAQLGSLNGLANDLRGAYDQNAAYFNQWETQEDYDRYHHIANLDTDSERWWVMSAEDAIKEMEDLEYALNFSMSLYSPEDQARMKARYAGLQSIYGDNAEAVREAWRTRSADLDEAVEFQKGLRQGERVREWENKYEGMSYYDLNQAMANAETDAEKAWLQQYAPTQMTEQDYSMHWAISTRSFTSWRSWRKALRMIL